MREFPARTILLFYDGYELKAVPGRLGGLYANARRLARFAWRTLRRRQTRTGFYTAFLGLKRSLESIGYRVRVNDFELARAHPDQPIGIAGYPSVIDKIDLPNPFVFGPGDYGAGARAVEVGRMERARLLTQPCEWAVSYNRQWVGGKGAVYFVGIDAEDWPDQSHQSKTVDFVVYDKIRWHREEREESVLRACLSELSRQGLTYRIVRYGGHHISEFRQALSCSKALLFLCEHETQGLACQEAMASGLPVLAWDEGVLVDPFQKAIAPAGLQVSSVPYFDERCGMTFTLDRFPEALRDFWAARERFAPRDFVTEQLSLERSGALYIRLLEGVGRRPDT